jgi:hypothetical protein
MPAPTAERLKVRCYRCNQLLAVAANKAGAVVACPKCKADLLIPRPEPQPSEEPADPSVVPLNSGTFPSLAPGADSSTKTEGPAEPAPRGYLDEIAALIPPEVAALRPEDLRVEAEFFQSIAREPKRAPTPTEEPITFPGSLMSDDFTPPSAAAEPEPVAPPDISAIFTSAGVVTGAGVAIETPPPLPQPGPAPAPEPAVVPPISIEPEAIRRPVDDAPRAVREVVLPASVVLAWSLLVLMAIPMAFLAGLMIGHFLWKTGP